MSKGDERERVGNRRDAPIGHALVNPGKRQHEEDSTTYWFVNYYYSAVLIRMDVGTGSCGGDRGCSSTVAGVVGVFVGVR